MVKTTFSIIFEFFLGPFKLKLDCWGEVSRKLPNGWDLISSTNQVASTSLLIEVETIEGRSAAKWVTDVRTSRSTFTRTVKIEDCGRMFSRRVSPSKIFLPLQKYLEKILKSQRNINKHINSIIYLQTYWLNC